MLTKNNYLHKWRCIINKTAGTSFMVWNTVRGHAYKSQCVMFCCGWAPFDCIYFFHVHFFICSLLWHLVNYVIVPVQCVNADGYGYMHIRNQQRLKSYQNKRINTVKPWICFVRRWHMSLKHDNEHFYFQLQRRYLERTRSNSHIW